MPHVTFDPEVTTTTVIQSSLNDNDNDDTNNHRLDVPDKSSMEPFEIDMGGDDNNNNNHSNHNSEIVDPSSIIITTVPSMDESIDEDNDLIMEMESLLLRSSSSSGFNKSTSINTTTTINDDTNDTTTKKDEMISSSTSTTTTVTTTNPNVKNSVFVKYCSYCVPCCINTASSSMTTTSSKPYRMGNIHVVYPPIYQWTNGWLVIGPHWLGPPFIILIVIIASYFIIYIRCYQRQWYMTTMTSSFLSFSTIYHLINTAYRDPGVITKNSLSNINPTDPTCVIPRSYRFCDTCQYYQPPHAAHCPDCNVCVAGFDHHCVWMSICIGVNNYKPFMRFNLSWLAYLIYAVVWVAVIAPIFD